MKKIRQWLKSRREMKLRKEMTRRGFSLYEAECRINYIMYGYLEDNDPSYIYKDLWRIYHLDKGRFSLAVEEIKKILEEFNPPVCS